MPLLLHIPLLPLNCPPLKVPWYFKLQGCIQLSRIDTVILDRIRIPHDLCVLKSGYRGYISCWTSSGRELDIPPTYISLVSSPSGSINTWCRFYLQILPPCPQWTDSILVRFPDHTRIKWWTIQIFPDNFMCFFVCISQPAGCLVDLDTLRIGCKERVPLLIAKLFLHFEKSIDLRSTRAGTGLKSLHLDSMCFQGICQMICCLQIRLARYNYLHHRKYILHADMFRYKARRLCSDIAAPENVLTPVIFPSSVRISATSACNDWQVICVFQNFSHGSGIFCLVCLCTQRMYGRSFGFIEHLDWINVLSIFFPSHRASISYQMTLLSFHLCSGCTASVQCCPHSR